MYNRGIPQGCYVFDENSALLACSVADAVAWRMWRGLHSTAADAHARAHPCARGGFAHTYADSRAYGHTCARHARTYAHPHA